METRRPELDPAAIELVLEACPGQCDAAMAKQRTKVSPQDTLAGYDVVLADVVRVIEEARRAAARSVNAVMAATYWLVGRRVVEQEQGGQARAGTGRSCWRGCLRI